MKRYILFLLLAMSFVLFYFCGDAGSVSDEESTSTTSGTSSAAAIKIYNQYVSNIPDNGSYYIPYNDGESAVVIYSEQLDMFTIENISSLPITLSYIFCSVAGDTRIEEFSVRETNLAHTKINNLDVVLTNGEKRSFYVRFYPVASTNRTGIITINYNDTNTFSFSVNGRGITGGSQGSAILFSYADISDFDDFTYTKLFGGSGNNYDEMATGMVLDDSENIYFAGNSKGADGYYYDIIYGKIDKSGNLQWAKVWGTDGYADYSPDSGENDETGGTAGAIKYYNGYLYIVGTHYFSTADNRGVVVMKIDPANGFPVWTKLWKTGWGNTASDNASGYAIDVDGGYVYITGTAYADAKVLILALNASDGSVFYQKALDISSGCNDRGYAIDVIGNIMYIGGWEGDDNIGFIAKITNVATSSPSVVWIKGVNGGTASRINDIEADDYNVYAAVDIRGSYTHFVVASFTAGGYLSWAKYYDGDSGQKNNIHVIKLSGDYLYAGGSTSPYDLDGQLGDGLIVKFKKDYGSVEWATFYSTGKGPDELAEHRVKGIAITSSNIYVMGQVYTGNYNGERYYGYWYNGTGTTGNYSLPITTLSATLETISSYTTNTNNFDIRIADYSASGFELIKARDKANGTPPDSDIFIMKMEFVEQD